MGRIFYVSQGKILNEYEEILERLAGVDTAKIIIETILNNPHTLLFTPYYHFDLIQSDPDDNKFVDCAVVANAQFIVTEDRHFDAVKRCPFPRIEVIELDSFLEIGPGKVLQGLLKKAGTGIEISGIQ